jgi:DNA-binding PadR family transcriptional regulator
MLLRLRGASLGKTAATPNLIALQEAGLVQVIAPEDGNATFALTEDGTVLLRFLGIGPAERCRYPN